MTKRDEVTAVIEHSVKRIDELTARFSKSDAPGILVGVARDGLTFYRKAFGMASVELGVANSCATRMRIGSTSKQFASLALLLLAEQGLVDLDTSIANYVPELTQALSDVTVRQLMNHTGGGRCDVDLGFIGEGMAVRPKGYTLASVLRQDGRNFAPGEKLIYNNAGYHLLSLAIDNISSIPFERFIKERIFLPLGMLDTDCVPSDLSITRGLASQYVGLPSGAWERGIFPSANLRAEGSMVSTIDDMLKWIALVRGPDRTIGSAQSWEEMTNPTRLNNGFVTSYGLGLMRFSYRGVEVIQHPGGVSGGSCQMLTVPSHGLDVIAITNCSTINPIELASQIVDVMLGDVLPDKPVTYAKSGNFPALVGRRYVDASTAVTLEFSDIEGGLGLSLLNAPAQRLHDDGQTLRLALEDIALGPFVMSKDDVVSDGSASELQVIDGGTAHLFARLPQSAPLLRDVALTLVGQWYCNDLGGKALIDFEGESLVMRVAGAYARNAMKLTPFSEQLFGWACHENEVLPLRGVLFVEANAPGTAQAFTMNTWRTRNLRFVRVHATTV